MSNTTVLSPINERSKKQTPLVSERYLVDTLFIGHYFLYEMVYLVPPPLQLTNIINNFEFELILAARENEYKRWFVKCFLNAIYFGDL